MKLNTDGNPQTVAKYGIVSIPTLNLVGGEVVRSMIGAKPKPILLRELALTTSTEAARPAVGIGRPIRRRIRRRLPFRVLPRLNAHEAHDARGPHGTRTRRSALALAQADGTRVSSRSASAALTSSNRG